MAAQYHQKILELNRGGKMGFFKKEEKKPISMAQGVEKKEEKKVDELKENLENGDTGEKEVEVEKKNFRIGIILEGETQVMSDVVYFQEEMLKRHGAKILIESKIEGK